MQDFLKELITLKGTCRNLKELTTLKLTIAEKGLNKYWLTLVKNYLEDFLKKLYLRKTAKLTVAKKGLVFLLPYFGQVLTGTRNWIQCCLKKNFPVFKLKVVYFLRYLPYMKVEN